MAAHCDTVKTRITNLNEVVKMAADKTSVNVTFTDTDGEKSSKAITNINPHARDYAVNKFCKDLYGLTNNTITALEKIERTDITTTKNMTAYALSISHAATHRQAFKNKVLEVALDYEDFADEAGWQMPVVTGTKPKGSTITVEKYKITIELPDSAYFEQGVSSAILNVEIHSATYPDSYVLRGSICISGFLDTDIVNVE